MIELGVNIDHVATLREARKGKVPDVITAGKICEIAGAHQITVHLRQDRRHIQDHDVRALKEVLLVRLNLEMATVPEIIAIAHQIVPHTVCLVPENRQEITTEGGLDVKGQKETLKKVVDGMHERGIKVSMFVDPESEQISASAEIGADSVELHTGAYANATGNQVEKELKRLYEAGKIANQLGLALHAGHGLTVRNLEPVARIPHLKEVNIGHDIIARSIFIGLDSAVKEILAILEKVSSK
ncbi:MAG TPA: pyridoxine 5'-phosphate synthase [Candidatus Hydrogenedens sp.]|nr:pyridoxine 5'-phosphate synthase [Candidatus Hydrogenedens sp.]HOK10332.1 pyridoxine 5'-phosphate synthase [Candidatus Hydrogenedens sp.]HOL20318.1 pyridoxine 5'-phosphate synthase [Candidatus Hydrogenedens sp.]HPP59841.1 pyridoxine 5'-phosphate synthase [Candidatus Hydrogenedens sp.]